MYLEQTKENNKRQKDVEILLWHLAPADCKQKLNLISDNCHIYIRERFYAIPNVLKVVNCKRFWGEKFTLNLVSFKV